MRLRAFLRFLDPFPEYSGTSLEVHAKQRFLDFNEKWPIVDIQWEKVANLPDL